ncbi:hypothetical protein ACP70R_025296 [Stipagrostis hirtigluma subsp. patula]
MARRVHAVLLLQLLLATCLLFQVSDCSRPFPSEPRASPAVRRGEDEPPHHRGATTRPAAAAEDDSGRRTRVDDGVASSSSLSGATTSAQDDGDVGVGPGPLVRALMRPALLLRSKLARRFLVGGVVEGSDSAAGASCRSFNVHTNCPPPA